MNNAEIEPKVVTEEMIKGLPVGMYRIAARIYLETGKWVLKTPEEAKQ